MPPTPKQRALALVVGCVLCLQFWALSQAPSGYRIAFLPPYGAFTPGELSLAMGFMLFLFPGGALIGFAAGSWISKAVVAVLDSIRRASRVEIACGLALACAMFVTLARLGNDLVLSGFPITDDEYANQFGGRILATGHVMLPMQGILKVIPRLFLFSHDNQIGSMDWIGPQAAWAIAEKTGLGNFFFAFFAAIPVPCVAYVCGRRLGIPAGLAALAVIAASPMFLMLSITTHTHVLSRAFLSLAMVVYCLVDGAARKPWQGLLLGLALALGFCCRPPEVVMLSLPLLLGLAIRAVKGERRDKSVLGFVVLGAVLPLLAFCLHSRAMTGNAFLPARFSSEAFVSGVTHGGPWNRFGANVSYNSLMLAIWFLGPLGVILVAMGTFFDAFTKQLVLGVVSVLTLGFLHDDHGIHIVGPIHYSECVVPLAIVAAHGAQRLVVLVKSGSLVVGPLVGALTLGVLPFTLVQLNALHNQARVQEVVHEFVASSIERPEGTRCVVLVPPFNRVWRAVPELARVGTWVHEWPRPRPDLQDEMLFLMDAEGSQEIAAEQFPERPIYRFVLSPTPGISRVK